MTTHWKRLAIIAGPLAIAMACHSPPTQAAGTAKSKPAATQRVRTLADDRHGFQTRIVTQEGYERDGPPAAPPAGELELIHYPSALGPLAAYVTPAPKDGALRPAVVWAHGGFGGVIDLTETAPDNDQSAEAFRNAGIVTMYPSWRGENDNPGSFEMYFGEVDDLLSAADYVSKRPGVDPQRIYLAGHSSGGTLVLLAAAASDRFRAAFSFGGSLGLTDDAAELRQTRLMGRLRVPFDVTNPEEAHLRSAIGYARAIRRPTFFFEGEDSWYSAMRPFERRAQAAHVPFQAFEVAGGTHWTILYSLTRLVAARILQDTGSACNIHISPNEVAAAFAATPKP